MFTQQADTLYLFLCPIVCIYGMMSKKRSTSKKTKVRVVMYFWTFWKKCEQQKKKFALRYSEQIKCIRLINQFNSFLTG